MQPLACCPVGLSPAMPAPTDALADCYQCRLAGWVLLPPASALAMHRAFACMLDGSPAKVFHPVLHPTGKRRAVRVATHQAIGPSRTNHSVSEPVGLRPNGCRPSNTREEGRNIRGASSQTGIALPLLPRSHIRCAAVWCVDGVKYHSSDLFCQHKSDSLRDNSPPRHKKAARGRREERGTGGGSGRKKAHSGAGLERAGLTQKCRRTEKLQVYGSCAGLFRRGRARMG